MFKSDFIIFRSKQYLRRFYSRTYRTRHRVKSTIWRKPPRCSIVPTICETFFHVCFPACDTNIPFCTRFWFPSVQATFPSDALSSIVSRASVRKAVNVTELRNDTNSFQEYNPSYRSQFYFCQIRCINCFSGPLQLPTFDPWRTICEPALLLFNALSIAVATSFCFQAQVFLGDDRYRCELVFMHTSSRFRMLSRSMSMHAPNLTSD